MTRDPGIGAGKPVSDGGGREKGVKKRSDLPGA